MERVRGVTFGKIISLYRPTANLQVFDLTIYLVSPPQINISGYGSQLKERAGLIRDLVSDILSFYKLRLLLDNNSENKFDSELGADLKVMYTKLAKHPFHL